MNNKKCQRGKARAEYREAVAYLKTTAVDYIHKVNVEGVRGTERTENILRQKMLVMAAVLSRSPWRTAAVRMTNLGTYVTKVASLLNEYI